MAGVRYISLHEKMTINGVFHDPLVVTPDIHTVIESTTFNNLYGPQIGGRAEVVTKHLEFGADLKLLFLGNTMLAGVQTTNLRSNLDPAVGTDDTTTSFSFGTDINTWAQINFTQNFTVRVGYTFMWINRVTRPEDNIYWNDNGPLPNPPGVVVKLTKHDFSVHGVSIGAEFRF
jgi:hypothetical protein